MVKREKLWARGCGFKQICWLKKAEPILPIYAIDLSGASVSAVGLFKLTCSPAEVCVWNGHTAEKNEPSSAFANPSLQSWIMTKQTSN